MTIRRRMAWKCHPLTKEEDARNHGRVLLPQPAVGRLVICAKCKRGGGTMVRKSGRDEPRRYEHTTCPKGRG